MNHSYYITALASATVIMCEAEGRAALGEAEGRAVGYFAAPPKNTFLKPPLIVIDILTMKMKTASLLYKIV